MYKLIIAGCRDFSDSELLNKEVESLLEYFNKSNLEIVSGACSGADKLGEEYAKKNSIKLKLFPADWKTYGKSAGFIRNSLMAEYSDGLIAFWDGKSKGTKMMINLANKNNLKLKIVNY